eukprot:1010112-Pyramimonas_sp.AAC.2
MSISIGSCFCSLATRRGSPPKCLQKPSCEPPKTSFALSSFFIILVLPCSPHASLFRPGPRRRRPPPPSPPRPSP